MQWLYPPLGGHQAFVITLEVRERIMNARQVTLLLIVAVLSATVTFIFVKDSAGKKDSGNGLTPPIILKDTKKPKERDVLTINYGVNAEGNQLEITANDSEKCDGSTKNGCFKIKKSKAGLIKFVFTNADTWELTQFTICQGTTPIEDTCKVDLTLDEQLEFFVMDDSSGTTILLTPKSGQVDLTQIQDGDNAGTFYLFDQNTIDREYYYNIRACPADGGTCVYLDPPIENKGRD
jgi:hypothetical protein